MKLIARLSHELEEARDELERIFEVKRGMEMQRDEMQRQLKEALNAMVSIRMESIIVKSEIHRLKDDVRKFPNLKKKTTI